MPSVMTVTHRLHVNRIRYFPKLGSDFGIVKIREEFAPGEGIGAEQLQGHIFTRGSEKPEQEG